VTAFVALRPSGEGGGGKAPVDVPSAPMSGATNGPALSTTATPVASVLTPDEMASAVPDETPVEVVPDEPITTSAKAVHPPGWKAMPKGHARLLVMGKGGACKVTINGSYLGQTPVDVVVEAGKQRIFCRMPTGSTRSKELRAPEYKVTKVEFEVKQ